MALTIRIGRVARYLLALAVVASLLAVLLATQTRRVAAESSQAPANAPLAAPTWISCTPVGVGTFTTSGFKRIHVRCATAVSGISFFAVSASDPDNAARALAILNAVQLAGRTLNIQYDPADTSGNAWGCNSSDCRIILGLEYGP